VICGKNGKQYPMSVSNLRRDNQNFPAAKSVLSAETENALISFSAQQLKQGILPGTRLP
jgi:hypothetical protein